MNPIILFGLNDPGYFVIIYGFNRISIQERRKCRTQI